MGGERLVLRLQAVARAEWERQLLPFVLDKPSVGQVLDDLAGLLAALSLHEAQIP